MTASWATEPPPTAAHPSPSTCPREPRPRPSPPPATTVWQSPPPAPSSPGATTPTASWATEPPPTAAHPSPSTCPREPPSLLSPAGRDHSLAIHLHRHRPRLGLTTSRTARGGDGTATTAAHPFKPAPGTTIHCYAGPRPRTHPQSGPSTLPRAPFLAWGEHLRPASWADGNPPHPTAATRSPVNLPPGTEATAIAATGDHSLAITSTGTVLAWGYNSDGQLGDGTTTDSSTPVTVNLPPGTEATAIAATGDHSLAITSTGTVLAWGYNSDGQLGDGTTTDSSTPVTVNLPPGTEATAIAAAGDHSLAITSTGTVLAWGDNPDGQLGDGTTTDSSTPVTVNLPPGTTITAIAAGDDHSLALAAPPTSTTTLQVTPANPAADQDLTLTATVTCNVDTPTGTITFNTNTTTLTTVPLTASGTAAHTTTLPTGTHTLTAHYTSTNTCPNSQSPSATITIAPPPDEPDLPSAPPPDEPDEPDLPITGPNLTTTTGAAVLFILAGVILSYAARRRPPHRAT